MLGECFYWLLNMSILGSLTGLLVLLLGRIRRLPRRWALGLWIIPFLRLCLPAGPGSSFSLLTPLAGHALRSVPVPVPEAGEEARLLALNCIQLAQTYFPITYKDIHVGAFSLEGVFRTAGVLWFIVAAALLLTMAILYGLTRGELKDAAHLRENIYTSPKITTPAVYGILRPRILLPQGSGDQNLRHVLAHERAHIRHGDNLWRLLGFSIAALHWFNPLVWLFLRQFLGDMELACDERVLAKLGAEERKSYALALVDAAENKNVFISAFGGAKIRTRVGNILSYKRLSLLSTLALLALTLAIACTLLTNPV